MFDEKLVQGYSMVGFILEAEDTRTSMLCFFNVAFIGHLGHG